MIACLVGLGGVWSLCLTLDVKAIPGRLARRSSALKEGVRLFLE
jgi:hypothetical protein